MKNIWWLGYLDHLGELSGNIPNTVFIPLS